MRRAMVVALLVILCAWTSRAEYAEVVTRQVPIDRVVANLELQARARPDDVKTQINLARAHGMAYASKTETLPVGRSGPESDVFYGHTPPNIPYRVTSTSDPIKAAAASVHLRRSIEHFKTALTIAPDNLVARLGLAWSIDQLGDKAAAISAYRDLIALAWKTEGSLTRVGMNFWPVTAEAADYLIPLLDKTRDSAEIASLRARSDKLHRLPRPITPVAVPLRDGLSLAGVVDDEAAVKFDADGLGAKSWTWITPDAAWLVYDQIGKGDVGSALQLFGSVTFWMLWDTGYAAMRVLDDNRDGRLAGAEMEHLGLWRDANSNGISERGEVRPLADYDIVSLSCAFVRAADVDRTAYSPRGVTFRDGQTRPTWDVVLHPAK